MAPVGIVAGVSGVIGYVAATINGVENSQGQSPNAVMGEIVGAGALCVVGLGLVIGGDIAARRLRAAPMPDTAPPTPAPADRAAVAPLNDAPSSVQAAHQQAVGDPPVAFDVENPPPRS